MKISTRHFFSSYALIVLMSLSACHRPATTATYFPPGGDAWARQEPTKVGMDADRLNLAVAFAKTQETTQMKPDFSTQEEIFGKLLGPMPTSRATTNGLILRHGYIVAEWGNTQQPDPTYSVAKSVLSTLVGISQERGLIPDIQQPVATLIRDGGYYKMQTFDQHLLELIRDGAVLYDDACAVASNPQDLTVELRAVGLIA